MSGFDIQGYTGDLVVVECDGDPYTTSRVQVRINNEPVEVFRITRMRDGGTTHIHTSEGYITYPRAIGEEDRRPRLNGKVIHNVQTL